MRLLLAILCCSCFISIAQDKTIYVECFFDQSPDKSITIYDAIDGTVVKSLNNNQSNNNFWYKLAIIDSDYGWFKIKTIQTLPNRSTNFNFENHWVKSNDFLITVVSKNTNQVYIYDLPTISSNRIHKLDNEQEVHITEVSEQWAKIKFTVGKKEIEGWLPFKNQCANPWSYCMKDD